jgi:NAD(P)-dependent dehydrogenase (short-subunit alcohol dehydrogenase family)
MRTLAFDVLPFGVISVAINPGWVKTDMGGAGAPQTPQQSVISMLRLIDALRDQDAGRFFNWDGTEAAW